MWGLCLHGVSLKLYSVNDIAYFFRYIFILFTELIVFMQINYYYYYYYWKMDYNYRPAVGPAHRDVLCLFVSIQSLVQVRRLHHMLRWVFDLQQFVSRQAAAVPELSLYTQAPHTESLARVIDECNIPVTNYGQKHAKWFIQISERLSAETC